MRLLAKTFGIVLSLAMTASSSSASACDLLCWLGELHAGCGIATSSGERSTGAAHQQPTATNVGGRHHCQSGRQGGEHESINASANSVQSRPCAGQKCALTVASPSTLAETRAPGNLQVAAGIRVGNVRSVSTHSRPVRSPGSPPGSEPRYLSISPLKI